MSEEQGSQEPQSDLDFLEVFRVKEAPATVYYIRDFITEQENEYLWNKVCLTQQPW